MSGFDNPFKSKIKLNRDGCTCCHHKNQAEHDKAVAPSGEEAVMERVVQSTLMRAIFPEDTTRRAFLQAVGAGTAFAALSTLFPLSASTAMAAEPGPLEKKDLKIGFIPITCATPIIMAGPMGFYAKQSLNVTLQKTAGWAV